MIGQSTNRVDGPLKVTGGARYAYERQDFGRPAVGYMLGASIAKGRLLQLDTAAAERAPGVLLVMTHRNAPPQAPRDGNSPGRQFARPWPVLQNDVIGWFGQPVALVVAESFEQARAAAGLIEARYEAAPGAYDLASHADRAYAPRTAAVGLETDSRRGDIDRAMAEAPVALELSYTTPAHFAQPMEPQACLAHWQGEDLHLRPSVQIVIAARLLLARTLQIAPERVHVDAAFVGGGFGSKLRVHEEAVFAALAARALGRPVKVAQTRRQVFTLTGRRPETIQRVRLAAGRDGRLIGLGHDVNMQGTERELFVEQTATVSRSLYAAPHRLSRHRVTNLDVGFGEPVRGPGELPGLLAVESAMDELAHALGMDPLELRIRNEPEQDPETGKPLSGRRLVECLREGAARFDWSQRRARPGSRREGDMLIGMGMASAIRMHFQGETRAVVRMERDGRVIVRSDMTDIGTGTYTILAQVAAEALGVARNRVTVELARSDLPLSPGSGGSWGAANTSNALYRACQALKAKVFGSQDSASQPDLTGEVTRRFPEGIEAEGATVAMAEDPNYQNYSQHTYGASFAEVAVDAVTGEVRLRRMLGVFAAGRIINPKTARSQLLGGMVWGVGSALHEAAHIDPRFGNVVNGDLAEYVVPVHADIPAMFEAVMLDDFDNKANPLGMKGVGELSVCGTGAAVANAVFNATGVRVRDFPITMEKLMAGLPPVA
jgi:xanthine dehydrogenase YagR molybdenum-binding subunit